MELGYLKKDISGETCQGHYTYYNVGDSRKQLHWIVSPVIEPSFETDQ